MNHRELGPGGSSPPTKRAKLDSTTNETAGRTGGFSSKGRSTVGEVSRPVEKGGYLVARWLCEMQGGVIYTSCVEAFVTRIKIESRDQGNHQTVEINASRMHSCNLTFELLKTQAIKSFGME